MKFPMTFKVTEVHKRSVLRPSQNLEILFVLVLFYDLIPVVKKKMQVLFQQSLAPRTKQKTFDSYFQSNKKFSYIFENLQRVITNFTLCYKN